MKVFTTPDFNDEVKKLSSDDRKAVYNIFNLMSTAKNKELLPTPYIKVNTANGDKQIYQLRQRSLRIYTTIEKIQGADSMVFIGLEKHSRNRAKMLAKARNAKDKLEKFRA